MFKELIEKANKLGITRAMLGEEMYGRSQYNRIYMLKNPTISTLDKLEKAIEVLKNTKKAKENRKKCKK
ncbi:MAG: hypothetical protein J6S85_03165 [Methanobrevibacter sp.]|nr:hypothetical protein [Methanobrevibacter sp.]